MSAALLTPRLVLRRFALGDGNDLHAMDGDDRVMRYIGTGLPGRTRDEVDRVLERMIAYAAAHPGLGLLHGSRQDDRRFVGGCGLYPLQDSDDIEIAYRLPYDSWGQGYATEMARAVLAHGFETLGLERIVGLTFPENMASQRVLLKIGMRDTGSAVHYGRTMRTFLATRAHAP